MMDKMPVELRAAQIIADRSDQFQEKLNAETEDGKYEILSALLSRVFETLKTKPLHKRLYPLPSLHRLLDKPKTPVALQLLATPPSSSDRKAGQ
jgi:hypothetical protein